MKQDLPDPELKQLFTDLRRQDERRAPSFGSTCHTALERQSATPAGAPRFLRLAVPAALIVVAVVTSSLVIGRKNSGSQAALTLSFAIAEWQSPTDFLLRTPGDELMRTLPELRVTAPETLPSQPEQPTMQAKEKL